MGNQQTCGQQQPWTGYYPACASVAWKVREWLGEAGRVRVNFVVTGE
jgi:hypothetical protein